MDETYESSWCLKCDTPVGEGDCDECIDVATWSEGDCDECIDVATWPEGDCDECIDVATWPEQEPE